MMLASYFDSVREGVRFLMAVGSVLGLLGLLMSCCLIATSHKQKNKYYGLLVFSVVLIAICGLFYGIKYFRI